jgi:hypothetical protein
MDTTRKIAVVTGVLFLVATIAALVAAVLAPVLTGAEYLDKLPTEANQVTAGALAYLVAAFSSAGIAISLYPVLKKWSEGLALASVVLRAVEAVMYIAAVVSLMSLVTVGQQLAAAGASDRGSLQAVGNVLASLRDHATLAAVFAFSLGAFSYYYLFFQSRLVPRWLSGWGIVATILMFAACVASAFSDRPVTGYALPVLPIALQEVVLAVWLIAKGFSPLPSPSAQEDAEASATRGAAPAPASL